MKKSVNSKKKSSGGIHIHLTNRWLYSLIALGILIVVAVGAYALTPGVAPANGHVITSIAPPSGCGSGTYLEWTGSAWSCASTSETDPTVEAWAKTNSGDIQARTLTTSGGIQASSVEGTSEVVAPTVSAVDLAVNAYPVSPVNSGTSCSLFWVFHACYYTSNSVTYSTVCVCRIVKGQSSGYWVAVA